MNCAPGKIGTPSIVSDGGASGWAGAGRVAASGAGVAGGVAGGGAGRAVPGRGNGCGAGGCAAAAPTQRTWRVQTTQRTRREVASLCVLCFLCVLCGHVRIAAMPSIIDLRDFCRAERQWVLETAEALVGIESPTTDKTAVDRCGVELAARLE